MESAPDLDLVHLTHAGVSLLMDLTEGRLPCVVHWGHELGGLGRADAQAVATASLGIVGPNSVDHPVRLAILPELHTGFVGRPGLSGSREGRNWSPKFTTTGVTFDGEPTGPWRQAGAGVLSVSAVDAEALLELALDIELLPSGLIRMRARLTNSGEPYQLHDLVLAMPVPTHATELLDFGGRWGRERVPQRTPFTVGAHTREGRKGRTGADAATLLHAGATGFGFEAGEVWGVHTAWSGNHTHYAESTFDGFRVLGGGELLLPGEVRLLRGDTYTSPWVYFVHGTGLDQVARRFHAHLRGRPAHVDANRPVTLNVWEAVYFDHDADRLIDLARRAAEIGIERYVLDDGWFGSRRDDFRGLGDWTVSADVWPDGLHPLVDAVTGLGMQFGLWFEPEMVNADSDAARAHPEWIMTARDEWPVESRHQQVINLGLPACYDHVLGQILALLDEYDIGYIKWDHNRDLIEAGNATDGGRPGVHAQTEAVYRMLAEIKSRHPGLEIESCSSGGARVDLGILEHTDRVWVSDCIDPLERQSMMRWTTQLLPPELMGSHIASGRSHTTGRMHDLNFRAATAVFGHLGVEWDLAEASDRALHELSEWIAFYKRHRGLLLRGDLVRMDDPGDGLWVHGVIAPDRSRAIFAVVTMAFPLADPSPRVRFRGLDADRRYRVAPALIGAAPAGLHVPAWWGTSTEGGDDLPFDPAHPHLRPQEARHYPGRVFTGRSLAVAGVQPPRMHPDQVVLHTVIEDSSERRG